MYACNNRSTRPLVLPRGKVIGPTFRFSVPLVDFKVIPYGTYVCVCPVECYVHSFHNSSTNCTLHTAHCRLQSHDYSNGVVKSHMNSNDMQDSAIFNTLLTT